jgi:serine protease Do
MNPRVSAFWARLKAHRLGSALLILVTLALGILIGTVISYGVKGAQNKVDSSNATPLTIPEPRQLSNQFAQVAKQLEPTVVNINTESTPRPQVRQRRTPQGRSNPGQGQESPFDEFFDRFFGQQSPFGGAPDTEEKERSLGSGVIVDPKGYILTNRHVVENADRVRVTLMDEPPRTYHEAKVVGTDQETDLAVIKIDIDRALPFAKLGNSDAMQVGDWVLAIGSPFNLQETVTAGIVSAKGRNIVTENQFQSFIQTDAAINPGNSGGPLVNLNGEVIGINTAILTETQGYQGVGFALPSNDVVRVYNQLIGPDHRVARGSIGVHFDANPPAAVQRMYGKGVVVQEVTPGSPAEQAGLQQEDVITAVDGKAVKTGDELVNEIASRKPGSKATLTYTRNGKEEHATVTVADRAKLFASRLNSEEEGENEEKPAESRLGLKVQPVTPEIASRLQVPAGKGVIVQDVKSDSFADDVGLMSRDIILQVNKQPVNSVSDFNRIQRELKSGQDVVFLVHRGTGRNAGSIILGDTLP